MSIARPSPRTLSSPLLRDAFPELSSPRMVTITDDPGTRLIQLNPGEDCLITAPSTVRYVKAALRVETDGMVTVVGGRNVAWFGGHFVGEPSPIAALTPSIDADGLTLTVASTTGFPDAGWLRVDGEGIRYTFKPPRTRQAGEPSSGSRRST